MGKGHRLQKKLKSERSKVKLKGSKHLPKGTNVTDTSFKIKQIVIREQLKTVNEGELVTKKKLNIKDLLSRLQHYNTTVRIEALNGLKELITTYNDIVFENLSSLLQNVSYLVLDVEKSVRRNALKLISVVIAPVSLEKISPFFETLCSYLKCAMTHIDTGIQEDSLLLLDCLLEIVPGLVAENVDKIFPNFIDLITKLRTDSKPGRTLTVSLGNKITDVKWRIKVLSRLSGIFDAIIKKKIKGNKRNIYSVNVEYGSDICLYRNEYLSADFKLNDSKITSSEPIIIEYVDVITRLLFDTWLEVGPNTNLRTNEHNLDSTLTEEAFQVLECVLNTLIKLWKYFDLYEKEIPNSLVIKKFVNKYRREFSDYVMSSFPYSQVRKRKRNETINYDPNCTNENLLICNIFFLFNKQIRKNHQEDDIKKIGKYIVSCMLNKNLNCVKTLLKILKTLFIDTSTSWSSCNVDSSQLLEVTIRYYERQTSDVVKNELFDILCDIVDYSHLNQTETYQSWLSRLPEGLLREETTERIIDVIILLAKQKNKLVVSMLTENFREIIRNLPKLKITNCENDQKIKYKIVFLFYWIPVRTENNLKFIQKYYTENNEFELKNYFEILFKCKR